jgi:hypothetical protein
MNAQLTELLPLSAEELLAGASALHEIEIPADVLQPTGLGGRFAAGDAPRVLKIRPLTIGVFQLIMKAARDEPGLIPLLMIKESLMEPQLTLEQVKQLHLGLVNFLVAHIREVSGLSGKKKSSPS